MGIHLWHFPPFLISVFEFLFGRFAEIPGNTFGEILILVNTVFFTTLGILYFYQVVFSVISIFVKGKKFKETDKYASYIFLTSARNEAAVIGQLINSIRSLDYPQDKIKIHVIADNCTDDTATIARSLGVEVFERENHIEVGKSYALKYYFEKQKEAIFADDFAGFIIVDTDNVYDKNYLKELNKVYQEKNADVIAAYRASTNIGDSFWAFGTGYSFLRECSLLHKVREKAGISSYVSGTSFFVSHKKIIAQDGWNYHTLIEDIQFSASHIIDGGMTHYAHEAIFYDEQPNNFKDSWNQRLRWVKGLYQVSWRYGWKLFKAMFTGKKTFRQRFSTFDSFLFVTPFAGYTLFWFIIYGILGLVNVAITGDFNYYIQTFVFSVFDFTFTFYVFTTLMTLIISFTNWKRIKMSPVKKILYPFIAFFFLITYAPMLFIAPFIKVGWKPVKHHGVKDKSIIEE